MSSQQEEPHHFRYGSWPRILSYYIIILTLHDRRYHLRGIVACRGSPYAATFQYYSYVKTGDQWLKFEDGTVTEVDMEDGHELERYL